MKEGRGHLVVVNEIKPSEAYYLLLPVLVGTGVDDGCHPAHNLAITIGEEVGGNTVLEGCIAVATECAQFVEVQIRHVIRIATIQVVAKLYEGL